MADLDSRQQTAVETGPVDVFISAGAGSGKTRVLTARFVSAVLGTQPYPACGTGELLAVTYTEKAAGELAERIRGALSAAGRTAEAREVGEAWISTIHGMCSRILRAHALQAGIDPLFSVLDDVESSALEAEALERVARASLDDEAFTALLDSYGFDMVTSAARLLCSKMHALGQGVADVTIVSHDEAASILSSARAALAELVDDFKALRRLATVDKNAVAVREVVEALGGPWAESPHALAAILAACGCKLRRLASVDGLDDLVSACEPHISAARLAAAQLLVAEHERAFVSFAVSFERAYAEAKAGRAALDFEDLQVYTAQLLESDPGVAQRYRGRFAMLMLDEFQDTNELQLRIVEQMSDGNLCTVGDENQSIYSFRHADVEVFRRREEAVGTHAPLDVNYRTEPLLLEAVNALFASPVLLGHRYRPLRPPDSPVPRAPWPESQPRLEVRFIDATTTEKGSDPTVVEAERIAERVSELMADGVDPSDIAILMRALAGGRAARVESALMARGIPVYIASGGSFFDRPEIREARAMLETISNVWDDAAFAIVLAGRLTRLSADALVALRAHAAELARHRGVHHSEIHLWHAATSDALALSPDDARALARTVTAIERARALRGTRPLVDTVLDPLLELEADLVYFAGGRGGQRAWSNVVKLSRIAGEYESATAGDLGGFLEYLDIREMHASSEQEASLDGEMSAVRVMSIHASKGLEFPVVIVAGLTDHTERGRIVFARVKGEPLLGMRLLWGDEALPTLGSERAVSAAQAASDAEAVRLMYVACTRAEESLTVIARTDPEKDAKGGLSGLVRSALGFDAAGSLQEGDVPLGAATARVRLVEASLPDAELLAAEKSPEHEGVPDDREAEFTPRPSTSAATPAAPPTTVSYTALATYGRCPFRFYLTSMLHLPAPPDARGGEALSFGSAVHSVLERCVARGVDPEPWLERAASAAALDEAGQERLRASVQAYLASPVAAKVFAADHVMRETPIAVPVGGTILAGAIDLIAWRGEDALIVDYKTGSAQLSEGEASERYQLQGMCYALAAFRAGAEAADVVFAEIERGREVAYRYERNALAEVEGAVMVIIERMERDGFPPNESYEAELCETCPGLGGLCPVTRPRRGEPV